MTVTWYYIRLAPGDLRPLPSEEMESFWRGQIPLPADEQRFVSYVGLALRLSDEAVMDIEGAWFARCSVREDGTCDQQAMLAKVNARIDLQRRISTQGAVWPPGQDVVDARDLFAARRLRHETRWEPDESDIHALKALVNERAGWNVV